MALTAKKPQPKTANDWVAAGKEPATEPAKRTSRRAKKTAPMEAINFTMDANLKLKLQMYCLKNHTTVSNVLRELTEEFLQSKA